MSDAAHTHLWFGPLAPGVRRLAQAMADSRIAQLGSGDEASELFHMINPINHSRTPGQVQTYKTEPYAVAGDVKLVSDAWDDLCRVEVTWGLDAPNGTPVETHFNVPKDWSITRPDRLCYRRASTPDNCDSGMTQWNTQWKCAARAGPGIEELSLQ